MSDEYIEQVGGEYGATVRYTLHENKSSVSFFAAEILAQGGKAGSDEYRPNYWQKGADSFPCDNAESFDNAERYFSGFVKWDGCSHVEFGGDDDRYLHLCGRDDFDKLGAILVEVYERCGQLMREAGTELLDGEFAALSGGTKRVTNEITDFIRFLFSDIVLNPLGYLLAFLFVGVLGGALYELLRPVPILGCAIILT